MLWEHELWDQRMQGDWMLVQWSLVSSSATDAAQIEPGASEVEAGIWTHVAGMFDAFLIGLPTSISYGNHTVQCMEQHGVIGT